MLHNRLLACQKILDTRHVAARQPSALRLCLCHCARRNTWVLYHAACNASACNHLHVTIICIQCRCLQEREAAQRAAELATRALAAEKRLVEAMKDEAAASAELLEAERAAKFAAQVRGWSTAECMYVCLLVLCA